ncbi:MAG: hypothetical protein QF412_08050 [Planctomycetota bacterium]|jgi:hypothetical protein|nr:hypothetical protein [Planctomycetota bacterium]
MRLFSTCLVALMSTAAAPAQCCIGAYHIDAATARGHFRAEARSLDGVGHAVHGPYHFRFELLERDSRGDWVSRGSFEKKFATKAHFNMDVLPSATGNGVFLKGPGEDSFRLFDLQGRQLARIGAEDQRAYVTRRAGKQEAKGTNQVQVDKGLPALGDGIVELITWDDSQKPRKVVQEGRFFLPLALHLTPTGGLRADDERLAWLARMLHWTPELGERQASEVREQLAAIDGPGQIEAAQELVDLGLSALPAIDVALAAEDAPLRLRKVRDRIREWLCGHRAPQDNLALLAGILQTGDSRLVPHARSRLRAILPADTPIEAGWILDHRHELLGSVKKAVGKDR